MSQERIALLALHFVPGIGDFLVQLGEIAILKLTLRGIHFALVSFKVN